MNFIIGFISNGEMHGIENETFLMAMNIITKVLKFGKILLKLRIQNLTQV